MTELSWPSPPSDIASTTIWYGFCILYPNADQFSWAINYITTIWYGWCRTMALYCIELISSAFSAFSYICIKGHCIEYVGSSVMGVLHIIVTFFFLSILSFNAQNNCSKYHLSIWCKNSITSYRQYLWYLSYSRTMLLFLNKYCLRGVPFYPRDLWHFATLSKAHNNNNF